MKKLLLFFLIFFALLIVFFLFTEKESEKALEESIDEKINRLTLEQKAGQVFMIGFDGTEMNEEITALIKDLHPGAVLLLGKNIESEKQLKKLTNDLQKIAIEETGFPLLIAVDQEGGLVSRVSWVENTPQSEIKTEDKAYSVGKQRAEELKMLGINLNLAPLLDILSEDDFLYNRGFIKDHNLLAKKIVKGQKQGGIISCIKHFPGYGGITFHPEDNLAHVEKVPDFSQFRNVNAEMIMVSNVIYSELSKELPFSFLKQGIDMIEDNYVILSDDLSQYSLIDNFSLTDIVSRPLLAGVDMLIFSGWRMPAREAVEELKKIAVQDSVMQKRIDEAVLKIITLKSAYFDL